MQLRWALVLKASVGFGGEFGLMLGPGPRGSGFRVWGLMFSPHVLGRSCSTHNIRGFLKLGFLAGVPILRGIVFVGLYWA